MGDFFDPDTGTVFYRSRDPIKNFKIRVTLERITSASIVPQAQLEKEQDEVELNNLPASTPGFGGQKDVEVYEFKWQEKVFSKREINLYSHMTDENCDTVLKNKYRTDTRNLQETGGPTQRLFSFVDHDDFSNKDESNKKFTTYPSETATPMAQAMSGLRHRKGGSVQGKQRAMMRTNIVSYEPSEESKKENHYLSIPATTMYVMGDLSLKGTEATTEEDEFVLCTIKIDESGVLSIKPDFNLGKKPYKIEGSGTGRDVFQYTLEHASIQLTRQEQEKEQKLMKGLYSKHTDYLSACVGCEFEMPPKNSLRLLCYGEIVSAQNFEYDDLFIHYFLDLPNCWHANGMQSLSGVTQTCATKVVGRDDVAYFSYPFSFDLIYQKLTYDKEKQQEVSITWPQLMIEVESLDSWQRSRTEGYGYISLPSVSGMHTEKVHCWRPAGRTVASELRRFFIGGSPELEDPTYVAVPSTHESGRLSKYGFVTISTGSVTIKLHMIQQSDLFLVQKASKKKMGNILDQLGISKAQTNIMDVIEEFKKAKQKLVHLRENAFRGAKNRMVAARNAVKADFVDTIKSLTVSDDERETEA